MHISMENSTVVNSIKMGHHDDDEDDVGSATPVKIVTGILVIFLVLFCVFCCFFLLRHRRKIGIVIKTFSRDARGIARFIRTFKGLRACEKAGLSVCDVFDKTVARTPSKICFEYDGQNWTFQEVLDLSNQVGNYFTGQGYEKGDVVALYMDNRPEYVCIWLGLSKIGVVTSLINSNLRLLPLKHSFEIANPKAIIYGEELSEGIADVLNSQEVQKQVDLFVCGQNLGRGQETSISTSNSNSFKHVQLPPGLESSRDLGDELKFVDKSKPDVADKPTFSDSLFYIYTSGTTGLPKAAIIKHARFMMGSISFHCMNCLKENDVIYTCLPLYHTAGGLCGVGQSIFYGNTVILRKKFSASRFWKDCVGHKVTVAQYIGEICRYLLAQPTSPEEKQHKIRAMIGNGLRPEIWKEFVERFSINQISEIYGSTDGNCNFVNFDNRVGAVGFVPILLHKLYPMGLMRVDEVTGEPIRDPKTGLVVRCKPNEVGELVGKIVQNNAIREFQGYAGVDGVKATEKKVAYDVFSVGDMAFRTGDYLVMDEFGYFYFKDRAGDTYRWKGENVSTAQVEAVVSNICDFKDSVVYGVKIPGTDGRAGMVTVAADEVGKNPLNLDTFADGIYKSLPPYARPLFLRVSSRIETTGTHKLKKVELQNEGFDVTKIREPIYFYTNGKYVQLDEDLYFKIIEAKIRI